jgi:hypothetical protein
MDKEFLLKEFRLGFKKVKDKETGKVYVATRLLEAKVSRLNTISVMAVVFGLVILIGGVFKSAPLEFAAMIIYFVLITIGLKWYGKKTINEDDLKDVVEKDMLQKP